MIGSAADLFAAAALKTEVVEVRGQKINVRELTDGAREEVFDALKDAPLRAKRLCAIHCAVGPNGQRLFAVGDMDKVAELPPDFIDAISDKAMTLSGIGGDKDPKP